MLMLIASEEREIMLMKITKDGIVVSKQQDNREVGFRHYMKDHFPSVKIVPLELPFSAVGRRMMPYSMNSSAFILTYIIVSRLGQKLIFWVNTCCAQIDVTFR